MSNPTDIQDTLTALTDKAVLQQYAVLEERLLRVFGSQDAAERELRDSPLSLCQTREGNLRGELPTLCLMFTCRRCGTEQAGPAIWTPEDLQNSKVMRDDWKCSVCQTAPAKGQTPCTEKHTS